MMSSVGCDQDGGGAETILRLGGILQGYTASRLPQDRRNIEFGIEITLQDTKCLGANDGGTSKTRKKKDVRVQSRGCKKDGRSDDNNIKTITPVELQEPGERGCAPGFGE